MWSIIQAAGWPIWPLIFASIIALALIFERLWSLRQSVVAPAGMVDHVLVEFRHTGTTQDLLARTAEQGPLGRILAAGLANVKSPRPPRRRRAPAPQRRGARARPCTAP